MTKMGVLLAFERAICRAGGTAVAVFRRLSAFVAGAGAFAAPQGFDGHHDEGQDDQQHYDGRQVHTMTALAMRKANQAQIQATTHWKAMMNSIHLVPNSRRTEAMAATQGV